MSQQTPTPSAHETPEATPETGQTGQDETRTKKPYFEVSQDQAGMWSWCLWAGNGRPMATNLTEYPRQNDCTAAIKTLLAAIGAPAQKIVIAHMT